MRIEIDTKHDSMEELAHLADMLRAISGKQTRSYVRPKRFEKPKDVFADPSPTGGLMNMFGDTSEPVQSSLPVTNDPAPTGDIFSIFNSEPTTPSEPVSAVSLFDSVADPEEEDSLSDMRLVPY
ncbi:hypothetical protein ACFL0V_06395 [Nanoarchaeota archaeon]